MVKIFSKVRFSFDPFGKGLKKIFGDLEADVMEDIWKSGPSSIKEVHDRLSPKRQCAYTTVATVMNRLASKGFLQKSTQSSGTHIFTQKSDKETLTKKLTGKILNSLFADFSRPAMNQFVDAIADDPKKLKELQKLLDERKGTNS